MCGLEDIAGVVCRLSFSKQRCDPHDAINRIYTPLGYGCLAVFIPVSADIPFPFRGWPMDRRWIGAFFRPIPNPEVVVARLKAKYPNAKMVSSTFDAYYAAVASVLNGLPVVTQEIGDTWSYGAASDPLKLQVFREISRRRGVSEEVHTGLPTLEVTHWSANLSTRERTHRVCLCTLPRTPHG